jgi:type II secretory pathway component PulF
MMMVTLIAGWYFFWYSPSARKKVGGLVLQLALWVPFLRGVLIRRDLAHLSAVLGRLLMAGAPLDRALESSALLDVNPRYKQSLMRVQGKVLQGHSLHEALDFERAVLPPSFVGLLALGEAGGRLPETLMQVAGLYRREALRSARVLLDLAAPLPVCGIGLFVFWVYSSLWLSIMRIPQLIQIGN